MEQTLGLFAIALGFAAFITVIAARLLDAIRPNWPLWRKLLLVAAAPPIAYILFEAGLFARLRYLGHILHSWYQTQDVFIRPALRLWFCGALCALFMGCLSPRVRATGPTPISSLAKVSLWGLFFASSAGLVLYIGLGVWIDTGRIGAAFMLAALAGAFGCGLMPVIAIAAGFFHRSAAAGMRRARPAALIVAGVISATGFAWHAMVAGRPGAWAVSLLAASALVGTFVGWSFVRRWVNAGRPRRASAERQSKGHDSN
jgi:hypothetical protein